MPIPANIVHQQSTTTGAGNLTLTTVSGKQSFDSAFSHGATTDVFDYFIMNQAAPEWERGTGHMSDSTTLVRDTVKESTNAGSAVSFSAGTKDITNDVPADRQKQDVHGADVASAGTINLDTATGDVVDVTGTTTITAITLSNGIERTVRFTGALTLTNGASLVLPSGANITTAAGDFAIFRGYASSAVRCVGYFPATGKPVVTSGYLSSKSVTFTRDSSTASGDQSVTLVGFVPTAILFFTTDASGNLSYGWTDSAKNMVYTGATIGGGTGFTSVTTYCIGITDTSTVNPATTGSTGVIKTFDSDGFTITWTKHGSPGAHTSTIGAMCFK